jgi:anti-sigma B factor antagonist
VIPPGVIPPGVTTGSGRLAGGSGDPGQPSLLDVATFLAMTAPGFSVRSERDGDVVTLVAAGEIDASTSGELDASIVLALADDAVTGLRIDLADVRFLDSSGLGVLLAGHRAVTDRGGDFVLAHPSGSVLRVLEITRVGDALTIEP